MKKDKKERERDTHREDQRGRPSLGGREKKIYIRAIYSIERN